MPAMVRSFARLLSRCADGMVVDTDIRSPDPGGKEKVYAHLIGNLQSCYINDHELPPAGLSPPMTSGTGVASGAAVI